ncbi:PREDICTED: Wilms tumor protein 1-interacting protein-like [Chinchilla lanigera]|uniref:Wilms tumor protein 1-interacting protein-like n=1 Tax=Chinchilla lanigera TaxID=34839 RepID=UPI00038EC2BC|nr:PREDICTED: Wilms tumor protein 1-interacting protein-like [Chinchilla lanigera]
MPKDTPTLAISHTRLYTINPSHLNPALVTARAQSSPGAPTRPRGSAGPQPRRGDTATPPAGRRVPRGDLSHLGEGPGISPPPQPGGAGMRRWEAAHRVPRLPLRRARDNPSAVTRRDHELRHHTPPGGRASRAREAVFPRDLLVPPLPPPDWLESRGVTPSPPFLRDSAGSFLPSRQRWIPVRFPGSRGPRPFCPSPQRGVSSAARGR